MTKVPLALALAYPGFSRRSRTTDTSSEDFLTPRLRTEFLEGYLEFRTAVIDARFRVRFRDNGMMSSPSDWCIAAAMRVRPTDTAAWTEGMEPSDEKTVSLSWWDELALHEEPGFTPIGTPSFFIRPHRFTYLVVFPGGLLLEHISTRGPTSAVDWA